MAKFKPSRGKKPKSAGPPQGALSCVVLVISAIVLLVLFMVFVMKDWGNATR